MAYRYGNRTQVTFLPDNIEQYVKEEDPVRVYDTFINCLDPKEIGLVIDDKSVGNSSYDPITMLKILVYGYSYGWRSSRKLERALHHNLSFIWLAGGLKPDFKTISNFRKNNLVVLKNILIQSVRLSMELNLIHGNILFTDGSKFRANAGNRQTKDLETWSSYKEHVTKRIDNLLAEVKSIDETETQSLVTINKELKSQRTLKKKIINLLEEFKDEQKINGTDPECRIMNGRQGSHAGYNVQATMDEANGLIVSLEGSDSRNDMGELSIQIDIAETNLGKSCETVCADAGYSSIEDLVPLIEKGKTIVVPSQKQVLKNKEEKPFDKDHFNYISEKDIYICPSGKELHKTTKKEGVRTLEYSIVDKEICISCIHYGKCTTSKKGRKVTRSIHELIREEIADFYESSEGQEIYAKRKNIAELQFGHFKRNLGAGTFLLRGMKAINAELGILGACFNLSRIINLMGGVHPSITKMMGIW